MVFNAKQRTMEAQNHTMSMWNASVGDAFVGDADAYNFMWHAKWD